MEQGKYIILSCVCKVCKHIGTFILWMNIPFFIAPVIDWDIYRFVYGFYGIALSINLLMVFSFFCMRIFIKDQQLKKEAMEVVIRHFWGIYMILLYFSYQHFFYGKFEWAALYKW